VLREWLQAKRGGSVRPLVPRRGNGKQLVDTAAENARQGLEQLKIKQLAAPRALDKALLEIAGELGLKNPPQRIEGYDISNIQGTSAVGSMVVFEDGHPSPSRYRRFKIRTVTGANDYAMLAEVLQRRFKHLNQAGADADKWAVPDLVLIDGGKGQLSAALAAMGEAGRTVAAASIAKENEDIFIPQSKSPILLPRSSPGLQLLQRIRDEAHRFAISYYARVHRRQTFASVLDGIPGIGPRRKQALLRRFGSVAAVREASPVELAATTGMSREQAKKIKELL